MNNNDKYKYENCFNFYFCIKCYENKDNFKTNLANTHKNYHKYVYTEALSELQVDES